jgi:hypothetical protein
MRTHALLLALLALAPTAIAAAAEHPFLAKARALYNTGDYEGAIAAAGTARIDSASADAAALVIGRAHLERFRTASSRDSADLTAAREALAAARMASLQPRDQVDLLVGLGQALFLADAFGPAAELFENALVRAAGVPYADRGRLLDWWATAVDREAQMLDADRRVALLQRVVTRMEEELAADPGHATANYWLAVASRGAGNLDRAWDAAVAAWVRSSLRPESAEILRQDLDRFVTTVLVHERARLRPAREQSSAAVDLRTEWDEIKEQWK